jgi:hypothetical protein
MPGINATSNNAAPAAITPIVAAAPTKSRDAFVLLRGMVETGSAGSDPQLASSYFGTALSRSR